MTLTELARTALLSLKPPSDLTVSEWADRYRILTGDASSEPGPFRTDRCEYQREIMNAFTDPEIEKIVVMTGAQCGKSEMVNNMIGRAIDLDPGPIMMVQPSVDMSEDYSVRRIAPMISSSPTLRAKVADVKSRDTKNTVLYKSFPGGSLVLTGANSASELASRPVRYIFFDETDRFPASAGTEGSPIELGIKRTTTFHNRKIVMTSTPTVKGAPIWNNYMSGTQEKWEIECPGCRAYHYIEFGNISYEYEKSDETGETTYIVTKAAYRCPECGNEFEEHMVKRSPGRWVTYNPKALSNGIRSFRLNQFASPWVDWKKIIGEYLRSRDDPELQKVFENTVLADIWEPHERTGDAVKLMSRREIYPAELPNGVLRLTMGVDTQDNRLEYEVVGWGRGDESWGILHGTILGRPSEKEVWRQFDEILDHEYTFADGNALKIYATFVDSGGHFTQEIYDRCYERFAKRVFAIKGRDGDIPLVSIAKTRPRNNVSRRENTTLLIIGVDSGKEAILYQTGVNEIGKNFMHFPTNPALGYDENYFKGLFSEHLVTKITGGRLKSHWVKERSVANEALDIRNYARAAHKAYRFDPDLIESALSGDEKQETEIRRRRSAGTHKISGGVKV